MAPEPGPIMSSLSRTLSAFVLALAPVLAVGLGALLPRPAAAQDLSALARVDPAGSLVSDRSGGIDLTLALSQGVPWRVFSLTEPDRIVMDFREIDWSGLSRLGMLNSDLAADLRFGTYRPGWSRLVLTLTEPLALSRAGMEVDPATGRARLSARFEKVSAEVFAAQAGAPRDPDWDLPEDGLPRPAPRDGDAPLTVVIDPGHGGIDPGAVQGGLTEKDLMLQLAQAVRETLIREGDTRVILTRNDDAFVSLERRVAIAHEVEADLFISLHADVLAYGRAHGATIYTLSDTATDEASAKLAERHDRDDLLSGVDLTGKDDVIADVLMDLARLETTPRTEALAKALKLSIEASGAPLNSHPMRAADFSVLKAADIPSVLIEVGFLSSQRDRKNLSDPAFIDRMALSIRDAILAWQQADAAMRPLIRQ